MTLRECDETFFWFLTLLTDEGELNLWPCRKCGAMVHGGLRGRHRKFHEELEEKS
jgi:hypothetical protein